MYRWLWLATLAACGFSSPKLGDDDVPVPDGPSQMDAPMPPPDTAPDLCFGSFVEVCLVELPGAPLGINSGVTRVIDTSSGSPDCAATMADVGACVVAATSITVDGTIRGAGPRPLILLATVSIQLNGTGVIDVASRRGSAAGAGANPGACVDGTTPTESTGGWGGSNAGRGGNGDQAGGGSTGGVAAPALAQPTTLRGGCPGGAGAGADGGAGGAGGGAVDLIAPSIIIDGRVNASGAGASGAGGGNGGGGAGSGGLIVLDAMAVTVNGSGVLIAQGGGGGEGGPSGGGSGGNGLDPSMPGQAAAGGSGSSTGGDGGNGGTTGDGSNGRPDSNLAGDDGGGGGGGGAGFIKTTDPTPPAATTKICPAFS